MDTKPGPAATSSDVQVNLDRLPLSEDLLRYYKDRIEHNESELQAYINALDAIRASHEEHHRLTWELQQRADEVRALQTALSESQAALIDERRQLLKVLAENDELRIQELKDRRKIRYLLGLCGQAVPEDETTYFKPSVYRGMVRSAGNARPGAARAGGAARGGKGGDGGAETPPMPTMEEAQGSEPGLALRDENQVLRLQVQALRAQLEEQQRVHKESLDKLVEDRRLRADEEKLRAAADAERVRVLTDKLAKHQEFLRDNTKEVLTIRKSYLMNERLLKEERVRLVEEVNSLRAKYQEVRGRSEQVERVIETRVLKKNEGLLHELRTQLAKYEHELRNSRVDLEEREAGSAKKIEALQRRLESARNDYRALKKRRDLEIEGFTNDILMLRRKVKDLERHIVRTAPLQDAELAVLRMVEDTGRRTAQIQRDVVGIKQKVQGIEVDLHAVPL
ncbi:hypothetical protein H9P43_002955 [Blastocladiella emersonii ATCC 22665]|nr:hypothetical protein H9P43_002955 [Blastocladiella emersonii ATCC 22665]